MGKILLILVALAFSSSLRADSYEPPLRLTPWQLTLGVSNIHGIQILSVDKIPVARIGFVQPGEKNSVESYDVRINWRRQNELRFSSKAELFVGNRFNQNVSTEGVSVLRLTGPEDLQIGDEVELQILGIKSRFGREQLLVESGPQANSNVYKVMAKPKVRTLADTGPVSASKIVDHGTDANRFVVAIVGDGYRSQDISTGAYLSDAQTTISYLGAELPWSSLLNIVNVYLINVVSNQAGADDPCAEGGECTPANVDTYFNSSYGSSGIDRLLTPNALGEERAIEAANEYVGAGVWDSIVMVVNNRKYGGSGGFVTTTSTHPSAPEIVVHELGHSIAGLADEYEDAFPGYPEQVTEPNVDTDGNNPKWSVWLSDDVPLPTPATAQYFSSVGAFEGARYKSSGVYRPMQSCKMRFLGVEFCPICKEEITESVLSKVSLLESSSPAAGTTVKVGGTAKTFRVSALPFPSVVKKWTLCGKNLAKNVKKVTFTKAKLSRASCTLQATLTLSTSLLRQYSHSKTVSWTVTRGR